MTRPTPPLRPGVARLVERLQADEVERRHVGPERWAHLPGGGRGIKQPKRALRLVVMIRRLVRPVIVFGWVAAALYLVATFLPELINGLS